MKINLKKNLFIFFSVLTGIFLPIRFAFAGLVGDLTLGIPLRIVLFFIRVITEFTIFLVGLSGKLLNWVLSPNFIAFSYTKPGPAAPLNPIIETGLGITQGFVNMLLVLVLVYIAIATILRLQEYQAQKLLPIFIVVALLVNFAPVICGLIVDASNIIMNFFVQDLGADAFGEKMGNQVTQIMSGFDWTSLKWEAAGKRVLQLYIMNGFLFVLTFILGIFTLIFTLRYLVIWLLVILSPLAFVAYILPSTRPYFEKWWQQFLAWTFIGVSCGFFLYLGLLMVSYVPTAIPAPTTGQGGLFDPILPYFVSAVFLGIGLVFGLQTSAIGAGTAISLAKRGQKAAVKGTARFGGRVAKATAGRVLGAKGKRWLAKQATAKPLPTAESLKGKGWADRQAARASSLAGWAARRGIGELGLRLIEGERKNIRKAEDKYKGTTAEKKVAAMRTPRISTAEKVGTLRQAIEEGQIKDLKDLGISNDEIINIGKQALKTSPEEFKKIRDAFPHLAKNMGEFFSETDKKRGGIMDFDDSLNNLNKKKTSLDAKVLKAKPGRVKMALEEELKKVKKEIKEVEKDKVQYGTIETKIVAKIKPEFIPKMDEGALTTKDALFGAQLWSGNQFKAAAESPGGKEFIEKFNAVAKQTMKDKGGDFFVKNNNPLYKYSVSSPGASLGIIQLGPRGKKRRPETFEGGGGI